MIYIIPTVPKTVKASSCNMNKTRSLLLPLLVNVFSDGGRANLCPGCHICLQRAMNAAQHILRWQCYATVSKSRDTSVSINKQESNKPRKCNLYNYWRIVIVLFFFQIFCLKHSSKFVEIVLKQKLQLNELADNKTSIVCINDHKSRSMNICFKIYIVPVWRQS